MIVTSNSNAPEESVPYDESFKFQKLPYFGINGFGVLTNKDSKTCTCDLQVLMATGCQCGGS